MNSIPASAEVDVIPSVLGTGGNPLSLNAVFLTEDESIPIGTAQGFPNALAVEDWFGPNSPEATLAGFYFAGFNGATVLPGNLYFVQANLAASVAGYLRGGSLSAVSLTTLQSYTGSLNITVDGHALVSAAINLASASSFANAATLIQTGLQTIGNSWTGMLSVASSETVTIDTTTTGVLHVGDVLVGTDIPVGATVTAFDTYTPTLGTGTVTISAAATGTAGPEAGTVTYLPTVTYDALRQAFVVTSPTTGATSAVGFASGSLAADLLMTQVTGAVLSAGAAEQTPAQVMNGVTNATQNWATFTSVFDPDNGAEPAPVKMAFANWVATGPYPNRYAYFGWDSNLAPTVGAAPTSFGGAVVAAEIAGTAPIFDLTNGEKAAFACGIAASIDFTATQGRTSWKYRAQAGQTPDVTSLTVADNLDANGYNYYAAVATADEQFTYLRQGQMPGPWNWIDPYINQIAMNAAFQLALMTLLTQVKSIPYNTAGYNLVRTALLATIQQFVNFGAIQPGIPLSPSQAQQVNTAAGATISGVLSTVGWYLQILPASAQTRGLRTSPPMTFWYTDGGSIQSISLASIDIE